jgi:hypothetical protein
VKALLCAITAALAMSIAGCRTEAPDYQSVWSTTARPTSTTAKVARPVPLSQYLESIGVAGTQVAPDTLPDLTVAIPTPPGWDKVQKPDITPTTELIAKDGKYPTAMLMVFQLRGDFDAADVVKHGNVDAQLTQHFKRLDESTADFHGFPSSMIQGSYEVKDLRLHGFNRVVIPTGSPPAKQRYLVQLTITSLAEQAVADSNDIEAIIAGFTVAAK